MSLDIGQLCQRRKCSASRSTQSSCCDEKCITEIARRDCLESHGFANKNLEKDEKTGYRGNDDSCKKPSMGPKAPPCDNHLTRALDKYGALLQNLQCLCKEMVQMGCASCCVEKSASQCSLVSRKSVEPEEDYNAAAQNGNKTERSAALSGCSKKCCEGHPVPTQETAGCQQKGSRETKKSCCGAQHQASQSQSDLPQAGSAKDSCCNDSPEAHQPHKQSDAACCNNKRTTQPVTNRPREIGSDYWKCKKSGTSVTKSPCTSEDGCCGSTRTPKPVASVQCKAETGCCSSSEQSCQSKIEGLPFATTGHSSSDENSTHSTSPGVDLENGPTTLEHILVNVQGMTCTGCETKLSKSLRALPGVRNIRTSLVKAEAEFDIDLSVSKSTVEGLIQSVERMTNFHCKQIIQRTGTLDIIVGGALEQFLKQRLPKGVQAIFATGKHHAQIVYNPRVIGARDVTSLLLGPQDSLSPYHQHDVDTTKHHLRMTFWMTILSALLTIPVLVLAWAPLPEHETAYGGISLGLATVVQFVVAGPFYPKALNALFFARMIEMDLLVVISTSTAYIFSIIAYVFSVQGRPLEIESFFETSTLIVTLIMCGRLATAFARQKATETVGVESLQIGEVTIVDRHGEETRIDTRLLQYGDIFKVYSDSAVPTDGTVVSGATEVDESMVTGESDLVPKVVGSTLIAGSINRSGTVTARLTFLPYENTIANIADMVHEANFSKPKVQELADRVASYFVPTVCAITIVVFVIWIAIGRTIQDRSPRNAVVHALTYALAALIVSCPCAIGLAVPMVIVVASDVAAKNGLIFRVGETIVKARQVSHVVFDKTGTLTQGKPVVVSELYVNGSEKSAAAMALALTSGNKHPVSVAIANHLLRKNQKPLDLDNLKSIVGSGIEAVLPDTKATIRGGNPRWLGVAENAQVQPLLAQNLTVFCLTHDSTLVAAFGIEDALRPDAITTVSELKDRGINISIVSGDGVNAVRSVAEQLDVPTSNIRFHCSPADKKKYIEDLSATSIKPKTTLFIGDGTNDAPALAQAAIGVHVNDGTEVAKSASDVVLLTPALDGILVLMDLSTAVMNRVKFNFGWSFIYNTFAILLAAGAFVNARIPPAYAGLGELVSVLPVIAAALQLRWVNLRR